MDPIWIFVKLLFKTIKPFLFFLVLLLNTNKLTRLNLRTTDIFKTPIFLILFFTSQLFYAQNLIVKGTVYDQENNPLQFASVALLKPADSIMVSFSITDDQGNFKLDDGRPGKYILQIYLSSFHPFYKNIELKNQTIDLKKISLETNVQALDEITITAHVPIQIKQDTLVFNASSFKIHPDDNIEDLLKKLPGLELNADGTLKSQGNEITKIYVDGKEFFSGDPAIALKNLSAEAINKVEIIDKKSDEAELTGVDDNEKNYVINLTLKKGKQKNGFGKIAGAVGLNKEYFANLNYNRFSPKVQFSVVGKLNNINMTGSNIQDFLSFTGGISDETGDAQENSQFESKTKNLNGLLTTKIGGINVGYEIKRRKTVNADYFYNFLENKEESHSKRISFYKINSHLSASKNDLQSISENHNLNFNYKDFGSNISRLTLKGTLSRTKRISNFFKDLNYFNEDQELTTTSQRQYDVDNIFERSLINLNYYRKLNNNKRNFGAGINISTNNINNDRSQLTTTSKLKNQRENKNFTTRDDNFKNSFINFNLRYTEPLRKNHFVKLQSNYLFQNSKEITSQIKIKNNNEEQPLDYEVESSIQSFNTLLSYNYNTPLLNIIVGSELQDLNRTVGYVNEDAYAFNTFYVNPRLSVQFKPNFGQEYYLNYRRRIKAPRISQNSPVINDLNPFYLRKGNPLLGSEQVDVLSLSGNAHSYKTNLNFYSKLGFQYINNAIIPSLEIDDNYVQTRSFINFGSQHKLTGEFNIDKRTKIGLRYIIKTKGYYKTSNAIIQKEVNDVISKNYFLGFSIENNNKSIFDIKAGVDFSKTFADFSIQDELNRVFHEQHYYAQFDYEFTKKLNLNTQFDYFIFKDPRFNSNQNIPSWNIAASYSFTKRKNSIVKILIIDILDKNINFSRRNNVNYLEETTHQTLGRYFILSFTYLIRRNGR